MQSLKQLIRLAGEVLSEDTPEVRAEVEARLGVDVEANSTEYIALLEAFPFEILRGTLRSKVVELGMIAASRLKTPFLQSRFLGRLASSERREGHYEKAIDTLRTSIDLLEAVEVSPERNLLLGEQHVGLAHVLNTLGFQEKAVEASIRGLDFDAQIPDEIKANMPGYQFTMTDARNTVGCVFKDAGDLEKAFRYFSRAAQACQILMQQGDADSAARQLYSGISNNMALALDKLSYQLEQDLVVSPYLFGLMHQLGVTKNEPSAWPRQLRERAIETFKFALSLIHGTRNWEFECRQLWNIGSRLKEMDPEEALEYLGWSRRLASQHGMLPMEIESTCEIARCHHLQGKPLLALREVRGATNKLERLYGRQQSLPVLNRTLSEHGEAYRLAALCCCDLNYLSKGLSYMERVKSRLLQRQMSITQFIAAPLLSKKGRFSSREQRDSFLDGLLSLLGDEKLGEARLLLDFDDRALEKVRSLLGVGRRLLVYFFSTPNELLCILVGGRDVGNGKEKTLVRAGEINYGWMKDFVEGYWQENYRDGGEVLNKAIEEAPKRLGTYIWAQIQPEIDRLAPNHLVLIPHTGLHFLPLHLIPLSENEVLLDRYSVSYAASLGTLRICKEWSRGTKTSTRRALVLGNPTKDLGFAETEAALVASKINDSKLLLREEATSIAFQEHAANADVLHLACHGLFDFERPTESRLVLSDSELSVSDLSSRQGVSFQPGALAVLSACESGIVALDQVDEFIGLPYGFLVGGCSTVICSLWPVNDLATSILIDHFYELLIEKKKTKVEALAVSQRWLRDVSNLDIYRYVSLNQDGWIEHIPRIRRSAQERPNERPFDHPFYWGAFVCHGFWG